MTNFDVLEMQNDLDKVKKLAEENKEDIEHLTDEMEGVKSALQNNHSREQIVSILYLNWLSFARVVRLFYKIRNTTRCQISVLCILPLYTCILGKNL